MSAVKGVNKTLIDAGTLLTKGQSDGRVKTFQDTYETLTLEIGSTIEMGPTLNAGARILEVILNTDDLTNSTDLSVGDAEVSDRYITATDHGSGALVTRMNNIAGAAYELDDSEDNSDLQIIITTATGIATGTIKLTVLFVVD